MKNAHTVKIQMLEKEDRKFFFSPESGSQKSHHGHKPSVNYKNINSNHISAVNYVGGSALFAAAAVALEKGQPNIGGIYGNGILGGHGSLGIDSLLKVSKYKGEIPSQ
jgi:hypothetical protein